ncbi:glycosyltransferase family 2 protein [Geminocystis sp.]|uniref:glycosyltransferase family 2 protein n=1 Tax=Geminocystis sp. TaxID=2664100 RepID=UPI0035935A5D
MKKIRLNDDENYCLSIVIPVYNGGENFHFCLDSIKEFAPSSVEVIIVADGDTDGSRNLATEFDYQLLVNNISQGPATARNMGAKIAKSDLICFFDADVTINQNTIPLIVDFFAQNQDISAIIGSYDDAPFADNFLSQYKNLFHHYNHQKGKENASTFWGACGIMRKKIFLEIGGFNENYRFPSVEDIELGYRLIKAGYEIRLCKDIQVKHLKKWTVISLLKAEIFYRAIPWTVLILKYQQIVNDLNLNWLNRFSIILVYFSILFILLSFWQKIFIPLILLNIIILLIVNKNLYQFFWQKKGLLFALKVIPWHFLYFFYGGLGFVIGFFKFKILSPNKVDY